MDTLSNIMFGKTLFLFKRQPLEKKMAFVFFIFEILDEVYFVKAIH
jgi:hypothetical protein